MYLAEASTHSVEIPFIAFNGAEPGPTLTIYARIIIIVNGKSVE